MNKKVLKTMIALVVIFLSAFYVLKIFFPEQFVLCIENAKLVEIGNYIDSHKWSYYLFGIFTSFTTYWLYLCAVCRKWYLNWWQILIVLGVIGGSIGLSFYDATLTASFGVLSMITLPLLFKADYRATLIVFSVHYLSQTLTLRIRNLTLYMTNINSLVLFMIDFECLFWLLLFYFYNNYKEK